MKTYDAVVVGSGPNGLAAAITMARAGRSVLVLEGASVPGGGMRTKELTLPGFHHDVCSTVHPLGVSSPFFRSLGLERYGLEWIQGAAPLVHVMSNGRAIVMYRDVEKTAAQLGTDARAYTKLVGPLAKRFETLVQKFLGPLRVPTSAFGLYARFGLQAIRSMEGLARTYFESPEAAALLAGIAAHAMVPLDATASASFGLILAAAAHAGGWPIARGGSSAITSALLACLEDHGGELRTGTMVHDMSELPPAKTYLFDITPKQLLAITGDALTPRYRRRLEAYRYGLGVFKMDWALSRPTPWADPACAMSSTVHVSGELDTIAQAELDAHRGRIAKRPFILYVQPTLFDTTRAPTDRHIGWAYCHVPNGSREDASALIEAELERYAPGFGASILARRMSDTAAVEAYNPNYIGGDINGGIADLRQLFFRPVAKVDPYATSAANMFICSSSTPPGGGVHGLCGYYAATSALRYLARSK